MYISNCLEDEKMILLRCETIDIEKSGCECFKKESDAIFTKKIIKNELLYKNLRFNDVDQTITNDKWKPFTNMRIMDCFEMSDNSDWVCNTYDIARYRTICQCTGHNFHQNTSIGVVNTLDLYKNIDNSLLSVQLLPPPPENSSIIIRKFKNDSIIESNI